MRTGVDPGLAAMAQDFGPRQVAHRASNSIACSMKRNELRFLISQRVPSFSSPILRTETLASQRNEPSCMLPSQMPIQTTKACSARA